MQVSKEKIAQAMTKSLLFDCLTQSETSSLTGHAELVSFNPQQMIFLEGSQADAVFLVFSGKIILLKEEKFELKEINKIGEGGYFGLEIFSSNKKRITSARAVQKSILIKLPLNALLNLLKTSQAFALTVATFLDSYELFPHINHLKLGNNENILFATRKHSFFFYKRIFTAILLLLGFNAAVLWATSQKLISARYFLIGLITTSLICLVSTYLIFLEWQNDTYFLTNSRAIAEDQRLFLQDKRIEIPLTKILNLNNQSSLIGRAFNFGDLIIHTFTEYLTFKGIENIEKVQEILQAMMKNINKIGEDLQVSGNLLEKIEPGSTAQKSGIIESGEESSSQRMFQYKTHWIRLISKVSVPIGFLISEIFFYLFINSNQPELFRSKTIQLTFALIGLIFFAWLTYQFVDWQNDQYYITENLVVDIYRKPFGTEDRQTAPIKNIQSIRYEKNGPLGLLFNFGTVYIRVGDDDFTFEDVPDPARIQNILFDVFDSTTRRERDREIQNQKQRIEGWLSDKNKG